MTSTAIELIFSPKKAERNDRQRVNKPLPDKAVLPSELFFSLQGLTQRPGGHVDFSLTL